MDGRPTLEARRAVSFDRGSPAAAIAPLLLSDLGHAVTVPDAGWVFDGDPFVRAPTTGMRILLDDAVGRGRFISEQDGLRLVDPTGWWADVMAEASVDQAATHHWEAPDFDELGDALDEGTRWVSSYTCHHGRFRTCPHPGKRASLRSSDGAPKHHHRRRAPRKGWHRIAPGSCTIRGFGPSPSTPRSGRVRRWYPDRHVHRRIRDTEPLGVGRGADRLDDHLAVIFRSLSSRRGAEEGEPFAANVS